MNVREIVEFQQFYHSWLVFYLPLGLLVYGIAATAELNRTPADIAEAESEIVAGFHTEYSGMKFGLFYAVELVNALAVSAVLASLFFGGWWLFGLDHWLPGWLIFIAKLYIFYIGLIWLRGTLPRFRIDQLMAFAWKMLLPLALVNVAIVATEVLIWRELEISAGVMLPVIAILNWLIAGGLIVFFFRLVTARFYRLPTRARLVHDISVPSLPAPPTAAAEAPAVAPGG
jgi:NADH-quinone oxidoreductase subunit H